MDTTIVLELAAFAALMGLSAFFSSSETALFSLSQLQQEQMRQAGNPSITLIETTKAIPPADAVIQHDGISFTVERVTMPTILEVRIRW